MSRGMIEMYVQFDYTLYDKSISNDGIRWRIPRMLLVYIFHKPIIEEIRIVFRRARKMEGENGIIRVFPVRVVQFLPLRSYQIIVTIARKTVTRYLSRFRLSNIHRSISFAISIQLKYTQTDCVYSHIHKISSIYICIYEIYFQLLNEETYD